MITTRVATWILAIAMAPAVGLSATITINASKDNTIYQSNSSFSAGGAAGFHSGTTGQGSRRRALLAFDIAAAVPAGSLITSAQLTLYLAAVPNANNAIIGLHKLTQDWGEGTAGNATLSVNGSGMGFAASPGDATWSDAKLGSATWANDGATGDYASVASATATVGGPIETPFTWNSTAELVADVQNWLDHPASNFGWALINVNEATNNSVKAFYSREATQNSSGVPNSLDPTWRPSLLVAYTNSQSTDGDYNGNGFVDAADYVLWRKTFGQPVSPAGSGADGDQSESIGEGDYSLWRARFGNPTSRFASAANIPEPATVISIAMVGPLVFLLNRR